MNDTFIKAKTIFDRMMEESLSRHTTGKDGIIMLSRTEDVARIFWTVQARVWTTETRPSLECSTI